MKISRSRTAIGIDIGSRNIKAAQLSVKSPRGCVSDGRYHVAALSLLPRSRLEEQIDLNEILSLRDLLRRQGFWGNDVVLAAPEEKLMRVILDLPSQASGAPVSQIARMELSRLHNVAPDSFELICWELPSADKSKSIAQTIAVGCPHDVANPFMDAFENAGFNVTALDVRSAAAARACTPLATTPPAAVTSLLDLEWDSTKLLLVWGREVVYEKFISGSSLATLTARLGEQFGLAESLAYQIVRTIGFDKDGKARELDQKSVELIHKMLVSHFHVMLEELKAPLAYASQQYRGEGIKRLLLIGNGAGIPGISQHLADSLDIEVMPAAPSDVVEDSSPLLSKVDNPALTVAVGLAKFAGG